MAKKTSANKAVPVAMSESVPLGQGTRRKDEIVGTATLNSSGQVDIESFEPDNGLAGVEADTLRRNPRLLKPASGAVESNPEPTPVNETGEQE